MPEGDLYRIGDDEFTIIYPDVGKAEFRDIIQKLKDTFSRGECKAAIGCEWTHSRRGLEAIVRSADQKMYRDKKQLYQQHAEVGRYRHQRGGNSLQTTCAEMTAIRYRYHKIDAG